MQATLPIIRELTTVGDSLMWIVGPGEMVSENTSRGIGEPETHGDQITIRADNWRFHLDAGLVGGIQFVETYGDLSSHYVRFSDLQGETLLRAYLPKTHRKESGKEPGNESGNESGGEPCAGNFLFQEMWRRYKDIEGVDSVRREVRMSSFK